VKAEHVFYDDIDGLPIALSPGTPFTVLETVGSIGEIVVKCSDQHPGFDIYHPDGHLSFRSARVHRSTQEGIQADGDRLAVDF
jgi:hypothetical protein